MGKIITTSFVTLNGVMQAPGGPEEDPANGFTWGGWSVNYWDEMMGGVMDGFLSTPFDLLLGRRTYEIFAAHWPFIKEDPVADKFNQTIKYVVSGSKKELSWQNSKLITGNISDELKRLKKQNTKELWVHGSSQLIQTLLLNNLIDIMHLWIFPVTTGNGKRLFNEGATAAGFKLLDFKTSSTGVIIASYEPSGKLITGSFALENPSEAEIARQKRHANEDQNH